MVEFQFSPPQSYSLRASANKTMIRQAKSANWSKKDSKLIKHISHSLII